MLLKVNMPAGQGKTGETRSGLNFTAKAIAGRYPQPRSASSGARLMIDANCARIGFVQWMIQQRTPMWSTG